MRRSSQTWSSSFLVNMASNIRRRQNWFTENRSTRQFVNLFLAACQYALKQETMRAFPVLVKIDISPLCNLACTYCVHQRPSANSNPMLQEQIFSNHQRMSVAQFESMIREIAPQSMAVALYYLGDPLVHPDLAEMCAIVHHAGLNSHISTNFSFNLSDQRLVQLVTSGLSHLTIALDAMKQETYERTRVGGRVNVVLDNLERILRIRKERGQIYPRIEVQYIKFQHNLDQLEETARWCAERGVDQFTDYWGNLHNYTDLAPGSYPVGRARPAQMLPRCAWPHFALQIKYDGGVIPCCYYRESEQYRPSGDSRVVGNVFESSIWDVWNSPHYKMMRRLVSNPERVYSEPELSHTFCDGCGLVFETDRSKNYFTADKHHWEELYFRDDRRRVIRKHDA